MHRSTVVLLDANVDASRVDQILKDLGALVPLPVIPRRLIGKVIGFPKANSFIGYVLQPMYGPIRRQLDYALG
jgi:hypothetical protein